MGLDLNLIDEWVETVVMLYQTDMARQNRKYEPRARIYSFHWSNSNLINGNLKPLITLKIDKRYL